MRRSPILSAALTTALAGALTIPLLAAPATAAKNDPAPDPAAACTATYSVTNVYPLGYQATVTVTAGPEAIDGWTTEFTLPQGTSVAYLWHALVRGPARTGTITVDDPPWNDALAPGASTSYSFLGTGAAPDTLPVSCT